jgi:hypothetical protein
VTDFFAAFYVEANATDPADWLAAELPALGLAIDTPSADDSGTATASGRWAGRVVSYRCRDLPGQLRVLIVSGIPAGDPVNDDFVRVCDNLQPLSAWLAVAPGSANAELAEAERLAGPILDGALDTLVEGDFPIVYLNRLDAALADLDSSARKARETRYGVLLARG